MKSGEYSFKICIFEFSEESRTTIRNAAEYHQSNILNSTESNARLHNFKQCKQMNSDWSGPQEPDALPEYNPEP
jgi:hypothetical protein